MWSNFYNWCVKHQDQISWFLIGLLTGAVIDSLADRNYIAAAVYAAIVYANYVGTKFKIQ